MYDNAFVQSCRNIVNRGSEENVQETGTERVSGPGVSIDHKVLVPGMRWFGGIWAVACGIGFSINLITEVHSRIPVKTIAGRWIKAVDLAGEPGGLSAPVHPDDPLLILHAHDHVNYFSLFCPV